MNANKDFIPPIHDEDLEYDEAGWKAFYQRQPFSGVAIEYHEDGSIYWQAQYLNGLKHGWNREWYT